MPWKTAKFLILTGVLISEAIQQYLYNSLCFVLFFVVVYSYEPTDRMDSFIGLFVQFFSHKRSFLVWGGNFYLQRSSWYSRNLTNAW